MGLAIASRPLLAHEQASTREVVGAGAIGAATGTAVSGAFHHFGPPRMPLGRPLATATLGVGLMTGLAAGSLTLTNQAGEGTNSLLASMGISAVAFGVPGIWIHGKNDFSGKPVASWKGTAGVAATGFLAGALIHQLTQPD